ncbi:MAG: Rne/Rng family ribonuclease [Deltaproteobacteria bacterium]|nr:Rne/Rng family ribonuclease [Deltaproteobacteria bacterium]
MGKKLIINKTRHETRVALLENDVLVEFYVERGNDASLLGNIYKGRVNRVLPGMQAAFVDIGLDRAAFLYVADVQDDTRVYEMLMGLPENEANNASKGPALIEASIEDLLTEGQEIMVQITKEPIGTKGARVSSHISLPGRYLVYMPEADHIGISRKIEDEAERERLKNIISGSRPEKGGFIIRTASSGVEEGEMIADMKFLMKIWEKIKEKGEKTRPVSLIHQDIVITLRVIRDILSTDIDEILIDSKSEYEKIISFMENLMLDMKGRVSFYNEDEPIFDYHGIEMVIDDMLHEKVWLKSGGYIIIETTEALTAIDVNTGRYTGKKNLEDTILKTNLEAAREIAYQFRLRNIGGIIIIDFIDMIRLEDRDKVYQSMVEALKKDRAITRVSEISELGLLEMTRKRIRNNIVKMLCKPCEYCEGRGYLKSKESISFDIMRNIMKEALSFKGSKLFVQVHPEISDLLLDDLSTDISDIEKRYDVSVTIKPDPSLHLEDWHIH